MTDIVKDNLTVLRLATLRLAQMDRGRALAVLRGFGAEKAGDIPEDKQIWAIEELEKEISQLEGIETGISLRDAFAIAALQGLVNSYHFGAPSEGGGPAADWADRAYLIADAMLARRKQ